MKFIHTNLRSLGQDVLQLYCNIKHPELESLFIKIANVEAGTFFSWLLKNKNIKSKLKHPIVYDAFEILGSLRNTFAYGDKISVPTIVRAFHEGDRLKTIPVIVTLSTIDDPSVNDVINPFRDLIDSISTTFKTGAVNATDIISDINVMKNDYIGSVTEEEHGARVRETIAQQRRNMFYYLLTRFTEEIAAAADAGGLSDLSSVVKSGALSKPASVSLAEVIDFGTFNPEHVEIASKFSDYVYKNYDMRLQNYNHDVVDVAFLNKAGSISQEDITRLRVNYEKNKDVTKYIEEEDAQWPGLDTSSLVTVDKRLNPDYLLMLSSFFVLLQKKMKMPSGFGF